MDEQSGVILDAIIVGAGFGGIYALHRMRQMGLKAQVIEAGSGIGGTWFWNRYPGARCDIESMQYSYSFSEEIQNEWTWSELYATQPEILAYINFVADKLGLRDGLKLNTRVLAATFDEDRAVWTVTCDDGSTRRARFCVMATGCLSIPLAPNIPGIENFEGPLLRTSDWPAEGIDLSGQTVGIIGTGSSGIQLTPALAPQAGRLVVYQRTPNYAIPAHNRPIDEKYVRTWRAQYPKRRAAARMTRNNTLNNAGYRTGAEVTEDQFRTEMESRWAIGGIAFMYGFSDITSNPETNHRVSEFVREKLAEKIDDPAVAETLIPKDYPIGAKRICVDSNYYETFNRDNVELRDIQRTPIEAVTASGIRLADGQEDRLDVLVLATGFDAMTGALKRIDITGRAGRKLVDEWEAGPLTYFGLGVAHFPNMFIVAGPGSPSVFSNMVTSAEQHVDWICDTIRHLDAVGRSSIEVTEDAQDAWVRHVNEVADATLMFEGKNSWYIGANVPGKPRVFMPYLGGVADYLAALEDATRDGYRGFQIA
ncbi:flavin-containing monooxygenase [Mesobacterium pallidum]|uniref:flavin-containing monooxygenase n=1 Tax=Mesobacterium pallidum TaxID=2872037 RepID=UPI001EE29F47|nr:NAD(P)/FAD-dependent oxidoreductase [Mesobacterium pallidum]